MPTYKNVLAIETSCDDTSVAIVSHDGQVIAQKSADQNLAHEKFGGVVPEIACRNHTFNLLPLVDEVLQQANLKLDDIESFAVTSEPGLIGSLLVGLVSAKSLALVRNRPFIGVNHLEGHLLAPFLKDAQYSPSANFKYPYIALAISGGHTSLYLVEDFGRYRVLGATRDDAAGEAYDKFAKLIGLGFPGGVQIDGLAKFGDKKAYQFPRPLLHEQHFDFSFSGLKSAAVRLVASFPPDKFAELEAQSAEWLTQKKPSELLANLCASYQEAIVDVLVDRLLRAAEKFNLRRIVVTGGVSANSRLRERVQEEATRLNYQLVIPPIRYCTDNAAMIGLAGIIRLNRGESSPQDLAPKARSPTRNFIVKEKLLKRLEDMGDEGPKRSLGQNFLISEVVVDRIIKAVERQLPEEIVEIGPGLGSLTDELLKLEKPTTLIELDRKFVAYWQQRVEPQIKVIEGDALQISWNNLGLKPKSVLVSNLPYQISSSLLIERSVDPASFSAMVLMFQKEVAQRIAAEPRGKDYGLLTVIAQNFWRVEFLCECSPRDYFPPPNVAGRVLVFKIRNDALEISRRSEFLKFVKAAFSHRRKLLYNNLKGQYFSSRSLPEENLKKAFQDLDISAQARAEELSADQFKELFVKACP